MWTFNTITMEWNEVMIVGDAPAQRSNCTMHYDEANNRIVLFGGGGAQKRRYNTISLLDWKTKEWIDIAPKQDEPAPEERTYHTSELAYPYLIVFGGEGVCDLDDLWVFNFLNLGWRQVPIDKTGVRPCARRFHSSALLGN